MYRTKSLLAAALLAAASHAEAASGMPQVLKDYHHPVQCADALTVAADHLIGGNSSKLYIDPQSFKTEYPVINGVINLRDRSGSVSFHALPGADPKSCKIAISETFSTHSVCIEIREDIFSKWALVGRLDDQSAVYRRQKGDYLQMAYLIDALKSEPSCLIHIYREVDGNVTPRDLKIK